MSHIQSNKLTYLLVVAMVTTIGLTTILLSRAATPSTSVEPESGQLSGKAVVQNNSQASGGAQVIFDNLANTYGPTPLATPTTAYVTPDQFGAVGDGIHDDTAAVQAALDAAVGKIMWIPANKTYLCSTMLSVTRNTTVEGAGTTSVLRFNWIVGATEPNSGGGSYIRAKSSGGPVTNISLLNFKVVGNGDGLPTGVTSQTDYAAGIALAGVNGLVYSHLEVMNTGGLGMSSQSSQNVTISNNYVHNTGRGGIETFKHAGIDVTNLLIEKNRIERTGDDSIGVNGLVPGQAIDKLITNITIQDNIISGWPLDPNGNGQGRGILINGVDGALVTRNNIFYSGGVNILVQGCAKENCDTTPIDWHNNNIQVTDNTLSRPLLAQKAGILIDKTDNSTFTGNTFQYAKPLVLNNGCTSCTVQAQ